ncbi:PREDICTED: uncharacterized protein C19orf44 homolog [Chrysochloris asiatica]|uniref:Uncharacterized protein C19orf44 homolog n=1 Tax=Chrysochloris asiatica TaxID=185453 RepID=A0A9B0U541_CHRAS|nr:PREDICTED: uncharacterized protein C19orf44 homolog [Chrysochloris asiatica]
MTSARKVSRSVHDLFGDFSDFSLGDSKMEAIRNLGISRSLTKMTANQSRFLKRNQIEERNLFPKESPFLRGGPRPSSSSRPLTTTSQTRASAALLRLAQIETKIRNRQAQRGLSDTDSDLKTLDASLPKGLAEVPTRSTAEPSSQKYAHETPASESQVQSGSGCRFLKKKEPPKATAQEARLGKEPNLLTPQLEDPVKTLDSPDSDEEEMTALLGSLMESSRERETRGNQCFTSLKISEKTQVKVFSTPGSRGPASGTSVRSGKSGRTKLRSSPRRSNTRPTESLSEPYSDSLNDFRLHILSLEDLAPAMCEKSDLEEEGEGARWVQPSHPSSQAEGTAQQGWPTCTRASSAVLLDSKQGPLTESEVSERLSTTSSTPSSPPPSQVAPASSESSASWEGQQSLPTESLAYSEDFEASPVLTASETTGSSQVSLDRTSETLSESSSWERNRPPQTTKGSRKWDQEVTRVVVKETAVQTLDPAFTYRWSEVAGVAAISPALGGTYVDPTPVASHVVSADAIEALTAHSPAMLVLNDLLRRQLTLTQQFLEANRHLHTSLLASLDQDSFHYHTLEEAKEYIRCHKPAPLTLEDALEQVRKEP